MDTDVLLDVLPHYLALLLIIFGVLGVIELAVGGLNFWFELGLVLTIAFLYRPLVVRLGVAPDAWS